MGGQGTLPSYRQVMDATTSNSIYEGASIAQQGHVERDAAVRVLQLHHVDGIQSTRSTVPGCRSPHLPELQLT